jgi:hypothetical protein
MKKALMIFFVAMIGISISTCTDEETKTAAGTADSDTLVYDYADFVAVRGDCNGQPCVQIKIVYPEFETDNIVSEMIMTDLNARLYQSFYTDNVLSSIEVLADSIYKAHQQIPNNSMAWTLNRSVSMLHMNSVITTSITEISALGGAHPNTNVIIVNRDAETGLLLELDDFLLDNARDELMQKVETAFRNVHNLSAEASLTEAGFWFKEGFKLPENYGFVDDGMLFYYNTYEVAPYAMGKTEFVIPFYELEKIIRPMYRTQ